MKKTLLLASLITGISSIGLTALEPSAFAFDVTLGGTASASDKRAMLLAIANENAARLGRNDTNQLSTATAADIRASYKVVLIGRLNAFHIDTMNAAVKTEAVRKNLTEEEMDEINGTVIDQYKSGVSVSNLVQALKSAK